MLFKDLLAIVTDGLADLAESRDPETRQHLIRMSSYSYLIAQELSKHPKYNKVIDQSFLDNLSSLLLCMTIAKSQCLMQYY